MKCMMTGVVAAALAVGSIGQAWAQAGDNTGGDRPRRPGMAGMAQELTFEKMDANNDGKVTLEEYQAAVQAAMVEGIKKRFQAMDANSDGVVTKEELQKAREMRGTRPPRPEGERGPKPANAPAKTDAAPAAAK